MAGEFLMNLDTPEEGMQEMNVRPLGNGLFLSLTEADPFSRYRILCGDKFEAEERRDGTFRFTRIVEPFDVIHFEVNLGLHLLDPGVQNREQKAMAFNTLGNFMSHSYSTPVLTDFFREHKGAWSLFEIVQHYTLFLHVPLEKRDLFIQQLPTLCPGVKEIELKEVFSGFNGEGAAL